MGFRDHSANFMTMLRARLTADDGFLAAAQVFTDLGLPHDPKTAREVLFAGTSVSAGLVTMLAAATGETVEAVLDRIDLQIRAENGDV